jgi:hypothetical protein
MKMWRQKNLLGDKLELKPGKNPLEGLCTESCYMAEEEKCTCRCHGAYHGLGRLNKRRHNGDEEEGGEHKNERKN